jgi:glycosyltransferase involved in cell wall biosynthesis
VVVAYDVLLDVFRLPITNALSRFADASGCGLVHYVFEGTRADEPSFDWCDVRRPPWAEIADSASRRVVAFPAVATKEKFAAITGLAFEGWQLLLPFIDPRREPHLDPALLDLWERRRLFEADVVVALPALNRDNNHIDTAIEVIGALRRRGRAAFLVLTYAPDNWWLGNAGEFARLRAVALELGLEDAVVFLASERDEWRAGIPRLALQSLYLLSDVTIVASDWEGFGLVAVEAALLRCPVVSRDPPVAREVLGDDASYYAEAARPEEIADLVERAADAPNARLRRGAIRYVDVRSQAARHVERMLLSASKSAREAGRRGASAG